MMKKSEDILELATPNIFSWQTILDYLNRESNEIMYQVVGKNIRRAFKIENIKYLCEMTYHDKTKNIEVKILNNVVWTIASKAEIGNFIKEWFDLETSLESFYELATSDSILKNLTKQFNGLRMVGMPDFYEAITWGILGQQINLTYTYTLKKRFTKKYGEWINFENHSYWIYPDPKKISTLSVDEMLELRLTRRKAEYLIDISKKITEDEISKEYYKNFENAISAEKAMVKIRGIGPWTANYVLMRCLRMGDAFPMADVGLLNGIKEIEKLENKPDKKRVEMLKKAWGPWCSYATFYIWRLLY